MEQKLLRLAKKLEKFTLDDLAITLEEDSVVIEKGLEPLLKTGQVRKADNGSYFYDEDNYFTDKTGKTILTKANKHYYGVIFTEEELQGLENEMQTSEIFNNSHKYIQKKVRKYVAIARASNGLFGRNLVHFLKNEWNPKYPEMKSSKDFILKARRLLKTHGIEALIPVTKTFHRHNSIINEELYSNFKQHLLDNRDKTLKQNYLDFKAEFFRQNPDTEHTEFPDYRVFTERVQTDIIETQDKDLMQMYRPVQKVKLQEPKKSGFTDFRSAANDFFEYLKNDRKLKKDTLKSYGTWIKFHMIPFFNRYRLDAITEEIIEQYKAQKTEEQLSANNIWSQMFILKRILTIYTPDKYVPPVSTSSLITYNLNILPGRDIRRLLKVAKEHYREIYPIILTALLTGMTKGEILTLCWENIRWDDRKIIVKRTIIQGRVRKYRMENAIREVDAPEILFTVLKEWEKTCPQSKDNLVFPDADGKVQNPEMLAKNVLKPLSRKTKFGEIRFIDLRDTYVSMLLEQNFPITYIQKQLGLGSIAATVNRYRSLLDKNKPESLDFLNSIF